MSEEATGTAEAAPVDTAAALEAEFNPQPAKIEAETIETGDDAAAETETEGQAEQPKPKKTVQERIDEMTRARREAEREADFLRGQLEALTKGQKPQERQTEQRQTAQDDDPPPNPDEYVYGAEDLEYTKDLARYEARQEFRRLKAEDAKATEAKTLETTHVERERDFAAKTPDYAEVVAGKWPCTQEMADALKTSELGPAVAYELAKNPDEARRIAALSPIAQIREIGRIEARLETQPAKTAKTVTEAPEPPPQARGVGGRFSVQADTSDFAAFDKWADGKLRA